jgi:hypothetical protein
MPERSGVISRDDLDQSGLIAKTLTFQAAIPSGPRIDADGVQ